MRATIRDVAAHANVSVASVSRYLNKKGYVKKETEQRIQEAIQALNYQPNEVARALFKRQTKMLGVIVPNIRIPFFADLVHHIEKEATKKGYHLLICNADFSIEREKEYLEMLKNRQIDGIIIGTYTLTIEEYLNLPLPIVSIDRQLTSNIPCVCSNHEMGGKLAAEAFFERGCKTVGYFGFMNTPHMLANKRYHSFKQRAEQLGMTVVAEETVYTVNGQQQHDWDMMYEFTQQHPELDGLFTGDSLALAALQIYQTRGKKVPDDIQIIGYDDLPFAKLSYPALSTIKQPIEEMGIKAVHTLLHMIEENIEPASCTLPVEIVTRKSTK